MSQTGTSMQPKYALEVDIIPVNDVEPAKDVRIVSSRRRVQSAQLLSARGSPRRRLALPKARSSSPISKRPISILWTAASKQAMYGTVRRYRRKRGFQVPTSSVQATDRSDPSSIRTATRGSSKRSRRGDRLETDQLAGRGCPAPRLFGHIVRDDLAGN